MLILLIITTLVSAMCCAVLLTKGRRTAERYGSLPQRFHAGDIPRLGGVAMVLAWGAGWLWLAYSEGLAPGSQPLASSRELFVWWGALLAAVGAGAAEDVTHRIRPRWRFLLTFIAALLATWGLGLRIDSLGAGPFDRLWDLLPYAPVIVVVLALSGLPHAFNLIDGYNGLAGTVALISSLTLAYVALQVGDRQIEALALGLAGVTAGFLLWNYPRGLIFAGDGGAYFWGLVLAILSVQLVQRHVQVSPWFPVLLLLYPIWETLFSIYRKLTRGQSPGLADALHFHQLIYRRVVREVFDEDAARRMLMRNNRTSPYLWGFTVLTVVPAAVFWYSTTALVLFALLFVVSYVWAYLGIIHFRAQRWVRRRRR